MAHLEVMLFTDASANALWGNGNVQLIIIAYGRFNLGYWNWDKVFADCGRID